MSLAGLSAMGQDALEFSTAGQEVPSFKVYHVIQSLWHWPPPCCRLEPHIEFRIEIRRESNPRGSKPPSHTVCDLNHSANRVYTIGTKCPHHMWWGHSVPIAYTRLAEWLRSQTVWDWGLLPRGFDSLRISMQNSSPQTPSLSCQTHTY